ncbi:MAG TPA: hypothetical protein VF647_13910 [Longimicrobium sp.]
MAPARRRSGLRRWQQEATRCWEDGGRPRDFLAEATPGAGETTFALHLAHGALADRHVDTLAVICPTTHLRRQWQIAAHRAGIEICSEIPGARLDQAFRGAAAARLRTALDPAGGWMGHALERAHRRLLDVRLRGHADAGGLVVCMDQAHARKVAERLRQVTGMMPAVALSDDPDASAVIARFTASREMWIVAVRQVSEGTDIPRLRVGVWATNASTELFFRQVVGRFVRVVPGLSEQDAHLYLPADPGLLRHARALSDERSHHLPQQTASDDVEIARARTGEGEESDFRALGSTGSDWEIVVGARVLAPAELERARAVAEECGLALEDPLPFALALREAAGPGSGCDVPVEARRRALRALLSRRVREYCARTGASHRDTFARLKRLAGKPVRRLNELALSGHVRAVERWLEQAPRPDTAASAPTV